jgi:hypothetical protein
MDDTGLKSLLTADAPPARDFAFELAVMARIEKRQFRHSLLRNAGMAVLAALVLALLAPPLELVWQRNFAPLASNVLIATLLLLATLFWSQLTARRN